MMIMRTCQRGAQGIVAIVGAAPLVSLFTILDGPSPFVCVCGLVICYSNGHFCLQLFIYSIIFAWPPRGRTRAHAPIGHTKNEDKRGKQRERSGEEIERRAWGVYR